MAIEMKLPSTRVTVEIELPDGSEGCPAGSVLHMGFELAHVFLYEHPLWYWQYAVREMTRRAQEAARQGN